MHDDSNRAWFGVNRNRVLRADALFIRVGNTVGARSAQVLPKPARTRNRPRGSSI